MEVPSSSSPIPKSNPLRYRTIPIIVCSVSLFAFAAYGSYFLTAATRLADHPVPIIASAQEDVSSRYDKIAPSFDNSVDLTERLMGITSLRKKLASLAHGDVLEVSIGTGRNLSYYDWNFKGHGGVGRPDGKGNVKKGKVRSFTAVDKSPEMLEIAHEKFSKMFPGILGVRWVIADAAEKGAIPGPPRNANERSGSLEGKYDTVVQTMGLCSVGDPVALLKNLGDFIKEEEGRILLLEHGRGRWAWLNSVLDNSAESHAKEFGCWWNRDLGSIVEESGLVVVKIQQPKWWRHGGTTWWIELKKPKTEVAKSEK
ncbi:S-adenosyl-L-methionine-dependent methyltransferase [Hyaloscypha variabilis F]|uniref:S-adenosyl-L-methionine-dependent methyltransferase n=1 Tax=Hyaloscypha variabilis (strain UAMH 11265 / GT02V1 / F) TaxID=1149755 RepID=A0A2J6SCB2_HYAVF|nr:S-adenosyl-L-methionine-dependent methyltransferase [Hyaloscypha variabilis F]